jgi:sugar lactone lactonase YvrE
MGFLVVADVDTVRAYDVLTGESFFDVPIPGAVFLNDVVVGPDQYAYVSDTATNTIHRFLPGEMPEIVLMDPSLDAPNGVMFLADQLYIGAIGSTTDPDILGELLIINGDVAETQGTYEGKLDGIEVDGANFLITEFTGQLRRVSPDGNTVELVRDFAAEDGLLSTADLGWDPETRQVAIPDLLGNQVAFWVVP